MDPLGYGDPLRLGPFRVLGVLGEGGMGKVYLGRDNAGRTAAVKVLRPELSHHTQMSRRFVREAEAAQAVRSEGVARVLMARTEAGRPFIATEFLAGPTLDSAVGRHGALREPYVRALGAALARTLGDIHAAGLVHRDLKPSNIVLTSTGPRVIDFGIARPEHGLTLTTTGQAPVTPGYGAPEQVLGQRTGPPGDVFALGAVLVYAATGAAAYSAGHVAAVQYEVVHGQPRLDGLPAGLRQLIEPCLSKDPALRPSPARISSAMAPAPGAEELWRRGPVAADIDASEARVRQWATFPGRSAHTDGDTTGGMGRTTGGTLGRPSRRRLITGLAAGGVVLTAGGGAWWTTTRDEDTPAREHPWDAEPLAEGDYQRGKAPAPLWGPKETPEGSGGGLLTIKDMVIQDSAQPDLIGYAVTDGKRRWTAKSVGHRALYSGSVDLILARDIDNLYGISPRTGRRKWKEPVGIVTELAVDGDTYLYHDIAAHHSDPGEVVALRVTRAGSREVWRKRMPFSPDADDIEAAAGQGRLVLTDPRYGAIVLDTSDGSEVWKLPKSASPSGPYVDGGTVYLGGPTLRSFRLDDGEPGWTRKAATNSGLSVGAVDDDRLYVVSGSELRCHGREDGEEKWVGRMTYAIEGEPAVAGNTVWVSSERSSEGVRAFSLEDGEVLWTWRGTGGSEQDGGERGTEALGGVTLAGAGNRVFALGGGRITALPVI
ncbi:protein kinase domain-containing protein [Streptomyces oceani]|uniref:Protein kinase domain-containing protein n=1 Tax=Streptomyces oceani TaxID=1075402 RepID=A0A1E7KCV3_9ACTN|nr:serine/threonine-protein kinase [Streptomyces oceani]OEV01730.1 hypothetical protein AN216_17065 [Streptomyces oceani]